MDKEILSRLAEMAGEHARIVMIGLQQELMPQWVLINDKGGMDIVGTPWRDDLQKDVIAEIMRQRMHDDNIQAYSVVVEAWAAQAPKGWKAGDPHIPSSEHPDRREVVIAFATDGQQVEWRQWATKRDQTGEVIALEPTDFDGAQASSWMTGLLKS
jgi:hypothetical protein